MQKKRGTVWYLVFLQIGIKEADAAGSHDEAMVPRIGQTTILLHLIDNALSFQKAAHREFSGFQQFDSFLCR